MPIIPAMLRLEQENLKFQASLDYISECRTSLTAQQYPVSQ
jgi:hypothetical protein